MSRIKWVRDAQLPFIQRTACGRFEVGGTIWTSGGGAYVRLLDTATGREYPCRTEASAKTSARNLLIASVAKGGV